MVCMSPVWPDMLEPVWLEVLWLELLWLEVVGRLDVVCPALVPVVPAVPELFD